MMDEVKAREVLGSGVCGDGTLSDVGEGYVAYNPLTSPQVTLDGRFDLEEIEAIAWWMRNKPQ